LFLPSLLESGSNDLSLLKFPPGKSIIFISQETCREICVPTPKKYVRNSKALKKGGKKIVLMDRNQSCPAGICPVLQDFVGISRDSFI
jgi:hypothetical protein